MKRKILALLLALSLAFAFCACGGEAEVYEINEENAWAIFPVEEAPVKTINAGNKWYSLIGRYLGDEFSLSVSESYDGVNKVYSTSGVDIWFFEANEALAAWCEKNGAELNFMVYSAESGKTEKVFSASIEKGFSPANVGVWRESVYFAYTDYAAKSAGVMRYDTATGELSRFCELEFLGEYSCTSLSVDGASLLISAGKGKEAELIKIGLESGSKTEIPLSDSADFVYACACDTAGEGYAVYYRDAKGAEHIGTVNPKNGKIKNIYSFGANVYAYRDTLELHGGHLYWVTQVNSTGNVADHYRLVDYDCAENTADEYLRTFSFSLAEDGVTLLSFNAVNYDGIYLTEIYFGGQ
jgi:hypothetical protein